MRTISALLVFAIVGLVADGVVRLRHDDFLTGTQLMGWALFPLALLLGFTWPVRCKVKTTRRKACGNYAYGFLFGCCKTAGHWTGKFLVRLHLQPGEVKPVERRQPGSSRAQMHQGAPQSRPVKVTVEDNARSICGFWLSVICAVAAVVQVITIFVH